MVFKPINLARQSFIKTFTHGYAQSLVAASQSSSAAQNTPFHTLNNNVSGFFAKPGPAHLQNGSQQSSNPSGAGLKSSQSDASAPHEGGLAAYYAAWQKHQRAEEKEWHQFQFAKRIGWKRPTTIPEPQARTAQDDVAIDGRLQEQSHHDRVSVGRSHTTTAADEIAQNTKDISATELTIEEVDQAIAQEIASFKAQKQEKENAVVSDFTSEVGSANGERVVSQAPSLVDTPSPLLSTRATSVSETDVFAAQLESLAENQRYAEIPALFQSILAAGLKPTASAYNALLLAAINLPRGKHLVVPKALDVYSDMLRRRVAPSTETYAILIELLAARALEVTALKNDLAERQARFGGMEEHGAFMFDSDKTEYQILAEDDSLSLAIRLFDTSAAVSTHHIFPTETYRLIISACAETTRVGDMVRVYADMESQQIVPPSAIFAPMIQAFGRIGDLRSAVECYEEYKALAIAHDNGGRTIVRKDAEVYAAVVKAYEVCGRASGGLKFLGKIEDSLEGSASLSLVRDTVALQALHPQWLREGRHAEALAHAKDKLSVEARSQSLLSICVDAADKNITSVASAAFEMIQTNEIRLDISKPAMAVLAMQVRLGDVTSASAAWKILASLQPTVEFIEPTTMHAISLIGTGNADIGLRESRLMFGRIREQNYPDSKTRSDIVDQIDEAIESLSEFLLKKTVVPSKTSCMEMIYMMIENGNLVAPLAERFLACLGPQDIASMTWNEVNILTQVQAGMLINGAKGDVGHAARFAHLFETVLSSGLVVEKRTTKLVEQALAKLAQPELVRRWQAHQYPVVTPLMSPTSYAAQFSPGLPPAVQQSFEDSFDPYGSSTDFKGSNVIAEELEKTYGRPATHLTDALSKLRNIRRAGKHPRYATYAKLITAAARQNKITLADEILAMAKQDVPLIPHSRVVRHGWISILDSMVGACLTVGRRDLASKFHQDLLNMDAAPSANTFGLYITTLKESTKTFDEATEAVKIFHRAKIEGVEPSSFLYNALIGKLGKARRIDDCLFYFAEMRNLGIRPTSVTYGTIVNALCRVSDDKFAEELFEEMESMSNYKPRPAPYNSLMQYFLTTKRDRTKVLAYYERMKANRIEPTMHTYKLLIDTHATLEPINMPAAEAVLEEITISGAQPEAVHYASLIHAKGCVQHDMAGARTVFDSVMSAGKIAPQASLYQALFESMVANHEVSATEPLLQNMKEHNVAMTPYIANTLIHGWALAEDISKARHIFESLGREAREPSTYEAMTRAYLAADEHGNAMSVIGEALRRGYPAAVSNKICELVGGGSSKSAPIAA